MAEYLQPHMACGLPRNHDSPLYHSVLQHEAVNAIVGPAGSKDLQITAVFYILAFACRVVEEPPPSPPQTPCCTTGVPAREPSEFLLMLPGRLVKSAVLSVLLRQGHKSSAGIQSAT